MFAISQILLGWESYKYYYETDELPNPRPTQLKKIRLKVAFGPLFPTANNFSWVGIDFIYLGNRLRETQPNQILRKHLTYSLKLAGDGLQ